MSDHEFELERTTLLAADVLHEQEAETARHHLESCELCSREYIAMAQIASCVGLSAEADNVASTRSVARVKKRLFAHVVRSRRNGRTTGHSPGIALYRYISLAACFVALVAGMFAYTNWRSVEAVHDETRRDRDAVALLLSTGPRYLVAGGAVIARDGRLYLVLDRLPALPAGHIYQAWTLPAGAKAVRADGTFEPAEHAATIVELRPRARDTAAVAVSIEPIGGSQAPTTKPLFLRPLVEVDKAHVDPMS